MTDKPPIKHVSKTFVGEEDGLAMYEYVFISPFTGEPFRVTGPDQLTMIDPGKPLLWINRAGTYEGSK